MKMIGVAWSTVTALNIAGATGNFAYGNVRTGIVGVFVGTLMLMIWIAPSVVRKP